MRVRKLSAAALAALAVAGLSGCRTNVGAAAVVNGHRITESDVHKYVIVAGASAGAVSQAAQNGQTLPAPKTIALNYLVQEMVFERVLAAGPGGVPPPAALRALHDTAAATLFQLSQTGAQLDSYIAAGFASEGVNANLVPVILRTIELEYALITRVNATALSDVAKAVARVHISVSVNPAYGTWDPTRAGVSAVPRTLDFLTPAARAASTPTG